MGGRVAQDQYTATTGRGNSLAANHQQLLRATAISAREASPFPGYSDLINRHSAVRPVRTRRFWRCYDALPPEIQSVADQSFALPSQSARPVTADNAIGRQHVRNLDA